MTPRAVRGGRAIAAGPSLAAARRLLGSLLIREDASGRRVGRLVELEAYVGLEDLASHAHIGMTARNAVMFGPPGRAYVYLTYGMHHCLNIVTEPEGRPAALLVRAVEPLEGVALMREARVAVAALRRTGEALEQDRRRIETLAEGRLAAGPGLVTAAFGIDRSLNGVDLFDPASPLRLEMAAQAVPPDAVATSPRIGMGTTPEPWHSMPWRFTIASPALSRPAGRSVSASKEAGR